MPDLLSDLQSDISSGNCVLLVGTGVSVALSGDSRASWAGFLESGINYALALGARDALWVSTTKDLLQTASTADHFLDVASDVVEALGGSESGDYSAWLRREIGYLDVRSDRIARALDGLRLPIVTTNYDGLLEKALGRDHVTWMQGSQFQLVLGKRSNAIAHLHGYWMEPRSVVLTADQYDLLLADREIELLRQAMASINSLVYVGFGDGMTDPHFEKMRTWIREAFPSQELQHYRLCRGDEAKRLTEEFRDDRIRPIVYGQAYEDLAPFIESLSPAEDDPARENPNFMGLQIIEELVRESAVLSTHIRGADEAPFTELLIPPVLLHVPPDQYVSSTRDRDELTVKPSRCNLDEEVRLTHIILAGDEHVGVTSAMHWMAGKICLEDPELIPVRVNFLEVGAGPRPLGKQVRKQLRAVGRFYRDTDALPQIALILDNVSLGNELKVKRVAIELAQSHYSRVLIGCRSGTETLLSDLIGEAGLDCRVRYVGRLARADVRELARLVDAPRATDLSEKAIEVVEAHRLPSTPFTFSMILSAILRGESLMAAASPTALLDAYMDLLLGKGSPTSDSRYGLDAFNRSFILAKLAEHYVDRRAGALPLSEVVGHLSTSLDELDWPENAVEVLKDLEEKHVLTIRSGDVHFNQNSYLHLFAAKRAGDSDDFRQKLLSEPLYYSPILAHHAALKRNDIDLLKQVVILLEPFVAPEQERSRLFKPVVDSGSTSSLSSAQLEERLEFETRIISEEEADDKDDLLPVGAQDEDLEPFPLQPVDELPLIPRLMHTVGLVSSVIRDTEIIPDQELRKAVLISALKAWATLADAVDVDERYDSASREVGLELAADLHISERLLDRFIDDLRTLIPLSIAFAGISTSLSSRKLVRTVTRCIEEEDMFDDPALAIMATFLLFDVQSPGWSNHLMLLLDKHESVLGVRSVLRKVMFSAYIGQAKGSADERNVRDFLVDQMLLENGSKGLEAGRQRGALIDHLDKTKLRYSRDPQGLNARAVAQLNELGME